MPDLYDGLREFNQDKNVQELKSHMIIDHEILVIPFDNWRVWIYYSVDENGEMHWEQSIRTPGPGHPETLKYYGPKNKGESNDVLPNRSSTPEPETSGENPGYGG